MGGGGEIGEGWNYFWTKEKGLNFLESLGGITFYFHTSLANMFNKCHKKAVFMKKTIEFGYIKYKLEGFWGLFFLEVERGGGGVLLF